MYLILWPNIKFLGQIVAKFTSSVLKQIAPRKPVTKSVLTEVQGTYQAHTNTQTATEQKYALLFQITSSQRDEFANVRTHFKIILS